MLLVGALAARLPFAGGAGGIMDDERLLVSDGAWHRGQRQRVSFETSCYYSSEPELPYGCQHSRSQSSGWRNDTRRAEERRILLSLFASTGGEAGGWRASDNWGNTTDPCFDQWYGVTCNEHGHIIYLELSDNGLFGVLPSDLGRLTSLVKLDLSTSSAYYHSYRNVYRNMLFGQLPSFAQAKRIEEIEVSGNDLESLPDDLFMNGPTLRSLSASWNRLTALPRFLRRFVKLHTLELGHNQIRDVFPADIGALANIRFVHLEYNQLRGEVGPAILDIRKIRALDLSHNPALGGQLPEALIVEWNETDYIAILNTSLTGYVASLCIDSPVCWRFMYDAHRDLSWATAADVPDLVASTVALARTNPGRL